MFFAPYGCSWSKHSICKSLLVQSWIPDLVHTHPSIFGGKLLRCWTLRTIILHYCTELPVRTLLCLHVCLSSLGVVLFSTVNTQGQPPIICPKVTLSDFPQSPQLKFFAEPHSRRLLGVGRVLSCEFRTKDSSLSEYWVSTFSRRDHHIPSHFPIYPNSEIHFACCTSLTTQSFCLLLIDR